MSHATQIASTGDENIKEFPPRSSGYIDYLIGNKISVTWRGGDLYLCNTCQGINRYRNAEKRGCEHCQRIVRYREEHPS